VNGRSSVAHEQLEHRVRELLAAGDADGASTAVIDALGPSVLGYLAALHGDDDGDDMLSWWAEDVWRGLPGFRFECPLRAWAFRLAWNASSRFRRDPWLLRRQRLPTSAASRLAGSVALARTRGRDERLERLRATLDAEEHTLLVLRLDREMGWDEISAVLSEGGAPLSSATLRKRYARLKDRLARRARRNGLFR
jgi:RNA polymerase sigma-70 factor, ECF subfamily